jgi:protein subunit release factor A
MKVYVVVDDGVQEVFRKKSSAVNYMLENILGFHISRTTFLRLVDLGEKKKYKFTAEDIEKYRQMSDKEFDKFITDSMDGSISKLKKVIRQYSKLSKFILLPSDIE